MRKIRGAAAAAIVAAAALTGCTAQAVAAPALPATAGTFAPATMPAGQQVPAARTPILILATAAQDARWHITAATHTWNAATGCDLFITEPDGRAHLTYRVVELDRIEWEGQRTAAATDLPEVAGDKTIELDPAYAATPYVVAHELGHTAGVGHTVRHDEVMSGDWDADRSILRAHEADMALDAQQDRCPGTLHGHDTPVAANS